MQKNCLTFDNYCKIISGIGITSYQVAKGSGVSQQTLSNWKLRGFTPKYEKLKRIADYLQVSIEDFYK